MLLYNEDMDEKEQTAQELLERYVEALSEPTRANLLLELEDAGELTATQLAKRLNLTVNNVLHHMRILKGYGVLASPRVVPGPTYVEKYYQLHPTIKTAIHEPGWLDRSQQHMSLGMRQAFWVAFAMTLGQLMIRAAKRYQAMDANTWNDTVLKDSQGMLSLRTLATEQYRQDLALLRQSVVNREHDSPTDGHVMIIAAFPSIFKASSGPSNAD